MNDQFPGGGNQPHSLLPTRLLGLGAAISRVEIAAIAEHMEQKCGKNSTETQLEIQLKISQLLIHTSPWPTLDMSYCSIFIMNLGEHRFS